MLGSKRKSTKNEAKIKNHRDDFLLGEEFKNNSSVLNYLSEIKHLVSCPLDTYEDLYVKTAYRLAKFCQMKQSFDENDDNADDLIQYQFQLAIACLKLRRGIFLPKNAGAEIIAVEEAQWTYAIFSAALLKGIHQLHIIPDNALLWLFDNADLFKFWWNAVLNQNIKNNDIMQIIGNAENKIRVSGNNDINKKSMDLFAEWAVKMIGHYPDGILHIQNGLFISEPVIDLFINENVDQSKKSLFQTLVKENKLMLYENDIYHQLTPKNFEDRRVLKGIILNQEFLSISLKKLPINTFYLENISL